MKIRTFYIFIFLFDFLQPCLIVPDNVLMVEPAEGLDLPHDSIEPLPGSNDDLFHCIESPVKFISEKL
jgi:hypothetical protein